MNTVGFFEIQSSDPKKSVDFYRKLFQWKFTRQESVPIEYYLIETGGIPWIVATPSGNPSFRYGHERVHLLHTGKQF